MKLSTCLAAAAALAPPAAAQTLLTHDGENATVVEAVGPPDPAFCGYPKGPIQSQFTTPGGFPCPLPGPVDPLVELKGDVTVHRVDDTVWVTDGERIAEYDPLGQPLQSIGVPSALAFGPVRGLGFDGQQGTLWLTDGQQALELRPPATICGDPTVVTQPFPLPPLGPAVSQATDVDWDPATQTLWICDAQGFVGNLDPTGALLSTFQAAPGPCRLTLPLTGLAVDTSAPIAGTLYVTDGRTVATLEPTGALATPTFGEPFACFDLPTATRVNGIGFSSRPIAFGDGGGVIAPPEIGSTGQAVIPSQGLSVTLSGAQPGDLAILPFSQQPLCPEIVVATVPVLIFPSAFALFSTSVDAAGNAVVPILIPPTGVPGLEVFYQWYVLGSSPSPDGPPLLSSGAGSMRVGSR